MNTLSYEPAPISRPSPMESLRVFWSNWKNRHVAKAYSTLTKAMQDDPGYAESWQANIAVTIIDNTYGRLSHEEANRVADRLMQHLFSVKMK